MALATNTRDTITSWYKDYLGRDPDAEGLAFWENASQTGGTDAIKKGFLNSAISNSTTGVEKTPTTGILSNIYTKDFGRDADAEGLNFWDQGAKAGGKNIATDMFEAAKSYRPPEKKPTSTPDSTGATGPSLLDVSNLERRNINPGTETVAGQLDTILAKDSPYIQQARNRAMMTANSRGLINSSIAAGAGEDAAISSALNIATPDAATFGRASDYNAALTNQAQMYNADARNKFTLQQMGIDADREARRDQTMAQYSLAQLQAETQRFIAEKNDATSRYNTDAQYRRQVDANNQSLVNNILMTPDLSPDRKAAMLEQLDAGTMAKKDASGKVIPGTGLAGAVYVIEDVAADLQAPPNSVAVIS